MHKLDLNAISSNGVPCTGFSLPIWIATSPNTVSYKAISGGAEYISFKATAPVEVQTFLDSAYSQMSAVSTKVKAPIAGKGTVATSFASLSSCK